MSWKDDFKRGFDNTYERVQRGSSYVKYPCYGGRFYWVITSRRFESLYFYLTDNALVYTSSGINVTEIPFNIIEKISVKRGALVRSSIHLRIRAGKGYHFVIKDMKNFSTRLTGDGSENVRGFIDTLKSKQTNT